MLGIFDRWRRWRLRKKSDQATEEKERVPTTKISPEEVGGITDLVAEYERLVKRRADLQVERGELTAKLDNGEITAIEFRKLLMKKIREAAQVAENLKTVSSRLIELGYRGVLH